MKAAIPRLIFDARLNTGWEEIPVTAVAVNPNSDSRVFTLPEYVDGRLPASGANEAALGYDLARILGLGLGDGFTLVTRTRDQAFQALDLTVVGLLTSPQPQVNRSQVYLPLAVAGSGLALNGEVTEVLIIAKDEAQVPGMLRDIRKMLEARGADARYLAEPWYEHGEMIRSMQMARGAYNFIYAFILFLASFVVVNALVMIVNERRREIGMISALGLRPGEIRQLFMYGGGIMGVLGSVIGVLVGSAVLKVLSTLGIAIPGTSSMDKAIVLTSRLYPEFSLEGDRLRFRCWDCGYTCGRLLAGASGCHDGADAGAQGLAERGGDRHETESMAECSPLAGVVGDLHRSRPCREADCQRHHRQDGR